MYSQILEPIVIRAINNYMYYVPSQTVEINTALATRTLPVLLENCIRDEIHRASVRETQQVLLKLFNRQLNDRVTYHVSATTAEYERETALYHCILADEPALYNYALMQKMLYVENAVAFDNEAARIKHYYNFERINQSDLTDIFKKFVRALRPQVAFNTYFNRALEELDKVPNRKKEMEERKFSILRILYEQKLKPAIKNDADKKKRIDYLIDAIKNIPITDHTDTHPFVRAITNWRLAKVHHKSNNDAFHPSSFHIFFHPGEKNVGRFIHQCLSLVTPGQMYPMAYKSLARDKSAGTVPHEFLSMQVEMF